MNNKSKRLDDLIKGIEQIVNENRSSFSDEELILLKECLKTLQEMDLQTDEILWKEIIREVIEVLIPVFQLARELKEFF